jgi:hypothetical protein
VAVERHFLGVRLEPQIERRWVLPNAAEIGRARRGCISVYLLDPYLLDFGANRAKANRAPMPSGIPD